MPVDSFAEITSDKICDIDVQNQFVLRWGPEDHPEHLIVLPKKAASWSTYLKGLLSSAAGTEDPEAEAQLNAFEMVSEALPFATFQIIAKWWKHYSADEVAEPLEIKELRRPLPTQLDEDPWLKAFAYGTDIGNYADINDGANPQGEDCLPLCQDVDRSKWVKFKAVLFEVNNKASYLGIDKLVNLTTSLIAWKVAEAQVKLRKQEIPEGETIYTLVGRMFGKEGHNPTQEEKEKVQKKYEQFFKPGCQATNADTPAKG